MYFHLAHPRLQQKFVVYPPTCQQAPFMFLVFIFPYLHILSILSHTHSILVSRIQPHLFSSLLLSPPPLPPPFQPPTFFNTISSIPKTSTAKPRLSHELHNSFALEYSSRSTLSHEHLHATVFSFLSLFYLQPRKSYTECTIMNLYWSALVRNGSGVLSSMYLPKEQKLR